MSFLKELGLAVNEISAELEDFGNKKYDPWYERISQAWWPWHATWRNPAPEMPMMKAKNRLDASEGGKYKEGAGGKLGKTDDVDRADAQGHEGENRSKSKPREDEDQAEEKPRRKKKKKRADEGEQSGE